MVGGLLVGWLAIAASSVAWAQSAPVLAVLDLENHTGDPALDAAGPGVAQILVSKFARVDEVRVVERARVEAVLDELDLQRSRAVDDASAVKAGQLLGARYLVVGQIFSVKLPAVLVSLRVVDVQTGQVIASREVSGQVGADGSEFFVLIDELSFEILDALQLRLDATDRIEFGQIDVRRLDTVEAYGKALQALDAGRSEDATRYLSEALALEPGFQLAEDELERLSAAISARRTEYAHAAVTDAHARWDRLRAEAITQTKSPATTFEGAAWSAIRGRFYLIDGQLVEHLAWEAQRAEWVRAHYAEIIAGSEYPESGFESAVIDLLRARGVDDHRGTVFARLAWLPSDIRMDAAGVSVLLGRESEAAAALITAYQDPGPLFRPEDRPDDPLRRAERLGLWDLVVVLRKQRLRLAELEGDAEAQRRALSELEDAVEDAKRARDLRRKCEMVSAKVTREPATSALLFEELSCPRAARESPGLALAGYQAFLARESRGYYDKVRSDSRFRELAEAWFNVATQEVWKEAWYADAKVAALLALNEQLPLSDPAAVEARRAREVSTITGWYPR